MPTIIKCTARDKSPEVPNLTIPSTLVSVTLFKITFTLPASQPGGQPLEAVTLLTAHLLDTAAFPRPRQRTEKRRLCRPGRTDPSPLPARPALPSLPGPPLRLRFAPRTRRRDSIVGGPGLAGWPGTLAGRAGGPSLCGHPLGWPGRSPDSPAHLCQKTLGRPLFLPGRRAWLPRTPRPTPLPRLFQPGSRSSDLGALVAPLGKTSPLRPRTPPSSRILVPGEGFLEPASRQLPGDAGSMAPGPGPRPGGHARLSPRQLARALPHPPQPPSHLPIESRPAGLRR